MPCLRNNDIGTVYRQHVIDVIQRMRTYWISLIPTSFSTPNVPICKFKCQIMFGHYADQHLLDDCADHHMSDHYANIIQLLLFVILTYAGYQKKP